MTAFNTTTVDLNRPDGAFSYSWIQTDLMLWMHSADKHNNNKLGHIALIPVQ